MRGIGSLVMALAMLSNSGCSGGGSAGSNSAPPGAVGATCDTSAHPILVAASAGRDDVNDCIVAATTGDTILIPSGTPTWSSGVIISEAITLQGAGSSSTVITSTASEAITLAPASDIPIRVTGIGFNLGAMGLNRQAILVVGDNSNNFGLTQIRLDHLAITGGTKAIFLFGWVHSLIDHVTFTNTLEGVLCVGDDDYSWIRSFAGGDVQAGTANAMFVEDSTFILNSSSIPTVDAEVYVQEGCNMVTRYNIFDSTAFTPPNFLNLVLNDHGNADYIPLNPPPNFRGQPLHEFYNNTIKVASADVLLGLRGNSYLIHDNTITCSVTCGNVIQLTEEEGWASGGPFGIQRTQWPAQDQVINTFIWNNTIHGNPLTSSDVVLGEPATDTIFIQENREFFMHEPRATGGKSVYEGRPGGSQSAPTQTDSGTLHAPNTGFTNASGVSTDGNNAYYPYTPYTYPHPNNK